MTFTLLAGAPIWGAYRLFVAADTPKFNFLENPTARFSFATSTFYTFCVLLAFPSWIFFDYNNNPPRWTQILFAGLFILDGAVWATIVNSGRIQNYLKGKAWMLATFVLTLIAVCGYLVIIDSSGFGIRHITAWFFFYGMISLAIYHDFAAVGQNRHKLPLYVFQVITYVAGYAVLIYPHISNRWGGGRPVDVTVTFSKDSSILPPDPRN
jgi:cytochrome bd-type quinol oxidase subunit 2